MTSPWFIGGWVFIALGIIFVIWFDNRDDTIRCPECGSDQLVQYGMGSYQKSFQCENGHGFSVPVEGA